MYNPLQKPWVIPRFLILFFQETRCFCDLQKALLAINPFLWAFRVSSCFHLSPCTGPFSTSILFIYIFQSCQSIHSISFNTSELIALIPWGEGCRKKKVFSLPKEKVLILDKADMISKALCKMIINFKRISV